MDLTAYEGERLPWYPSFNPGVDDAAVLTFELNIVGVAKHAAVKLPNLSPFIIQLRAPGKSGTWDVISKRMILIPENISWNEVDRVDSKDYPNAIDVVKADIEVIKANTRRGGMLSPPSLYLLLEQRAYFIRDKWHPW